MEGAFDREKIKFYLHLFYRLELFTELILRLDLLLHAQNGVYLLSNYSLHEKINFYFISMS